MPGSNKPQQKTIVEVYTYTFDENLGTTINIGSTATIGNEVYPLYDKDTKVGHIMYARNSRESASDNYNYEIGQCGLLLNSNKDTLSINYSIASTLKTSAGVENTEILGKATYSSGKYKNKDVNVRIQFLKNSKRIVTLTYKE
jgi:hypothetical protein